MLLTACSHDIYTHKSSTKCFSLGTFPRLDFGDLFLFRRRKATHTVYYILVMQCFRVIYWEGAVASGGLQIEQSRLKLWPGTLHCVLGQDTLLSEFLSPLTWASIPSRGSRNTPSYFLLQKPELAPA